jgi:hypothetical protein
METALVQIYSLPGGVFSMAQARGEGLAARRIFFFGLRLVSGRVGRTEKRSF